MQGRQGCWMIFNSTTFNYTCVDIRSSDKHLVLTSSLTLVYNVNMFFHGYVPPMRDLNHSLQSSDNDVRTVVLEMDGYLWVWERCYVAIGTIGENILRAACGGEPAEWLDCWTWEGDDRTLCLGRVGGEEVGTANVLYELALVLCDFLGEWL